MPKIIKDDYVTHIAVEKSKVTKIRFLYDGKLRKMSEWYSYSKAPLLINGALFDGRTGKPIENFVSGFIQRSKSDWCNRGFGITPDYSVQFGDINTAYMDFIVGFPCLVENSKASVNFDVGASLSGVNPRSVLSINNNEILLTTVDGRQSGKPGMTIKKLSEYMEMMGVTYSINLDGGGSTRMLLNGKVINSPTEDRAVSSVVAVWFDEEDIGGDDKVKICLDYGHNNSGWDTGASYYGYKEQDITFSVGRLVKRGLERNGISIIETRPTKETNLGTTLNTSLKARTDIANKAKVDYFISIHCNANSNTSANGTETYIQGTGGKAELLAKKINPAICNAIGTYNRGVKVQNLAVTRETSMPAVLVELAFLSNKNDCDKLINRQLDIAEGVVKGVCEFLGITYKGEVVEPTKPSEPTKQPNKYSYDDTVEKMVVKGYLPVEFMIPWEKLLINNKELRDILEKNIK